MSLITGKKLHAFKWAELPINEEVIERVDDLVRKEKQPILSNGTVIIEWGISNERHNSDEHENETDNIEEPPPAETDIGIINDKDQSTENGHTLEQIEEQRNEAMLTANKANYSTLLEEYNNQDPVGDSDDFFQNDELSLDSDNESEECQFVPDQAIHESTA